MIETPGGEDDEDEEEIDVDHYLDKLENDSD